MFIPHLAAACSPHTAGSMSRPASDHVVLAILEETSVGDRARETGVALELTPREAKAFRALGEAVPRQPNSTRPWSESALAAMAPGAGPR